MKKHKLSFVLTLLFIPFLLNAQTSFINEIHYDNVSTDSGEGIEIAGPAGTSLSGWSLVLYNGNGGTVYNTVNLSGTISNQKIWKSAGLHLTLSLMRLMPIHPEPMPWNL